MKAAVSSMQAGFLYNYDNQSIRYPVEAIFGESTANIKLIDSTKYIKTLPAGSILNYLAFKDQALININAALYVKYGNAFLFDTVPFSKINALQTYVQNEIEDLRAVEKLIVQYVRPGKSTTPVSIAVFGAPGSGKSFGVKQIV